MEINQRNIGKIAERIVMNEFDACGYRATDLNKDGLSPNADLLVVKGGIAWQIQVKGSANNEAGPWRIAYGWCRPGEIADSSLPFFNKHSDGFYTASHVVFVAVRSPVKYRCFCVPVAEAEQAAQHNLDGYFRQPKASDGGERKAGKMYLELERARRDSPRQQRLDVERQIILPWEGCWDLSARISPKATHEAARPGV